MFVSGQAPQYGVPQGSFENIEDNMNDSIIPEQIAHTAQAQPTVILPASLPAPVPLGNSWNEVQTSDGRVYYFNAETRVSQWTKPEDIMTEDERAAIVTGWMEIKIWDGRSYFYNEVNNCSVWHVPPEIELARGNFSSDLKNCVDYDSLHKTETFARNEFLNLLQERSIDDTFTFDQAVSVIQDDYRFSLLPSDQSRQLLFASFISNLLKRKVHAVRDAKRQLFIQAVTEWKDWKGMSESVTFSQMEGYFKDNEWFQSLETADLRALFQVFSIEYIEIEKLKKRKLQDALMHEMKNDILSKLNVFDLASPSVIETIFSTYSSLKPHPQFWTYLSDSQKLVVIKSCISQRIRELRMAVANRLPLSREKRTSRQEKDRIKKTISEFAQTKAETKVVRRGQGLMLPSLNTEMEAFLAGQGIDLAKAKELFAEFVEDMKVGKDPLEGII